MSSEQLAAPLIRRPGDRASVIPGRFRGPFFGSPLAHLADKASINFKAFWLICTLAAIESLWAYAAGLKIAQGSETLLLLLLPIAAGLLLDAFRVVKRCSLAANFLALWLAWLLLGSLLSYLAASLNFALYDATFAWIDEILGFNWVKWFQFVASYPALDRLLSAAYLSMFPQIILAIVFFSRPDRAMYGEELWWTTMIAVIITCVISGLLPAMCAWSYYQMSEELNIHIPDLMAIRDGTMNVLPLLTLKGIVTFPSFHAAMAVLLIYPYRKIKALLPIIISLNCLMLASVPTRGGHYLVDVLAGIAVAVLSIAFFQMICRKHVLRFGECGAKSL